MRRFTELAAARNMLLGARAGLKFSPDFAAQARPLIEAAFTGLPEDRLLSAIRVLTLLAD